MKLALTVNAWLDEELMYAQQLGTEQIMAWISPEEIWEGKESELAAIRNRVEKAGFELLGLDTSLVPLPAIFSGNSVLSSDIEAFTNLITNAGATGIKMITYAWDGSQAGWERLEHFLNGVLPAAEKARIRLAGRFASAGLIQEWANQIQGGDMSKWLNPWNGLDLLRDQNDLQSEPILDEILKHSNLCERLFLVTYDHIRPDNSKNDNVQGEKTGKENLFASLLNMQHAGCKASIRPYRSSLVSDDIDYQDLAYTAGYLRAFLQTLEKQNN